MHFSAGKKCWISIIQIVKGKQENLIFYSWKQNKAQSEAVSIQGFRVVWARWKFISLSGSSLNVNPAGPLQELQNELSPRITGLYFKECEYWAQATPRSGIEEREQVDLQTTFWTLGKNLYNIVLYILWPELSHTIIPDFKYNWKNMFLFLFQNSIWNKR